MNLLVSYAHIVKDRRWIPFIEFWASKGLPVMIDSGAFSAVKSGVAIDHREYMTFVKQWVKYPNVEAIQLDKPRDAAGTRANLDNEYVSGLQTIPVFVATGGYDLFAELVSKYNRRVCVAGGQNLEPPEFLDRLKRCQQSVDNRASIHALGFTPGLYPLGSRAQSFDSTSWLAALKWGSVHFYDPVKGVVNHDYKSLRRVGFDSFPHVLKETFVYSGITEKDLRGPYGGRTQRSMVSFLSADAWLRMAVRYEKAGKRFFFAAVKPWMLTQLILAMKHQRRKGIDWKSLHKDMPALMDTTSKGVTDFKIVERHFDVAHTRWTELV